MANGHTPGIVCVFAPFCGHKLVFMHLILPCTLSTFQWENFSGQVPTESLRTQDSENVYERWVQQIFDPVLPARSWEMTVDDRDGEDDYSDMPAATIPPSVWQSANLQILCQPPQHWVGNKDKGSLV